MSICWELHVVGTELLDDCISLPCSKKATIQVSLSKGYNLPGE